MTTTISPYRLEKARSLYNLFSGFNNISWTFLAGNIITLFAMRIHATQTLIGALTAINYSSFFFLFLGRQIAKHISIIRVYAICWIIRTLSMCPLLAAPWFSNAGKNEAAIALMLIGVSLFHLFRGIGMVANNPVLSFLSQGADRASYMTTVQNINNGTAMLATFAMALFLGNDAPLFFYSILMGAGIIIGVASGVLLLSMPEPVEVEKTEAHFGEVLRDSFSQAGLRKFFVIMFLGFMVSSIERAFVLVYAREVFSQSDGMVSLYSVFGCLGALVVGLIIRFLIDRIGAKPIYILCTAAGVISIIPAIFFSEAISIASSGTSAVLFLSALFFFINFSFLGLEGVNQTYFLGLVPRKYMLDMSIVYWFFYAASGAVGTLIAGFLLDGLSFFGFSYEVSFRVLNIIMISVLVLVLVLQRKLTSLGSLPLKNAVGLLFSFRDLRAIALLEKLGKTESPAEEEEVLLELGDTSSTFAVKGILEKVKSPRFSVRIEALNALSAAPNLDAQTVSVCLADLKKNTHTTAYISARILGKYKIKEARDALVCAFHIAKETDDFILCGETMIALSRLGDKESAGEIAETVRKSKHPRIKIMGFEALAVTHNPEYLSVLLDCMLEAETETHIKDEAVIAISRILDCERLYYKLLVKLLDDPLNFGMLAKDEAESAFEYYKAHAHKNEHSPEKQELAALLKNAAKNIQPAVFDYADKSDATLLSSWIMLLPETLCQAAIKIVVSQAVLEPSINEHDPFRLLAVLWSCRQLRMLCALL